MLALGSARDDHAVTLSLQPSAHATDTPPMVARTRALATRPGCAAADAFPLPCRAAVRRPLSLLRLQHHAIAPIPSRAGDLVALWPRHPSHVIVRADPDGHLLGRLWLPTDDAFALLRYLVSEGTLRPLTMSCAAELFRPPRYRWWLRPTELRAPHRRNMDRTSPPTLPRR